MVVCVCFTAYHTPLTGDLECILQGSQSCVKHKVSFFAAPVFSSSHLNVDYVLQHNPGRADHTFLQTVYASCKNNVDISTLLCYKI